MCFPPKTGGITSVCLIDPVTALVGFDAGQIFQLDTMTFDLVLLSACHTGEIQDIAFPRYVVALSNGLGAKIENAIRPNMFNSCNRTLTNCDFNS
jgi:hypothetical protein